MKLVNDEFDLANFTIKNKRVTFSHLTKQTDFLKLVHGDHSNTAQILKIYYLTQLNILMKAISH